LKSEITDYSLETTYYRKGFLAGQELAAPVNNKGDLLPPEDPDRQAWIRATELFQQTGSWITVPGLRALWSEAPPLEPRAHLLARSWVE